MEALPARLNEEETARRLPYPELAKTIGETLLDYGRGDISIPERTVVTLPEDGRLLVMPAADDEIAITKLVTVHPGNPSKALPTIQGEVVVMRADNGWRLGILDGSTTTGRRTAALSLRAAQCLAPVPEGPLLVIGAGVQARAHVEAFRAGLGTERLLVVSRTRSRAEALVDHAKTLGMDAAVVDDVATALREAKLIVTATTSMKPVLDGRLAEDTMVCAVGAFREDMAELSVSLVGHSNIVVDTLPAAREEAGDLIDAVRAGAFAWEQASTLAEHLAVPDQELQGPIVFKSVGHALFDLAAARLAFTDL